MGEITVTLPLKDYEIMRNQIETLRKRDIRNYVESKGMDILANSFVQELNVDAIVKDLKVDYPNLRVK